VWNLAGAVGLLLAMVLLQWYGRKLAIRIDVAGDTVQDARTAQGAVFVLLGLLIAFTFSGGLERFDSRRRLVVEETNAIGTAWYRIDLLPADRQAEMRDLFRKYTDNRIQTFRDVSDVNARRTLVAEASALQRRIWDAATAGSDTGTLISRQVVLLPALNSMFDISTTREAVTYLHPPLIIYLMIGALACLGAVFSGYGLSGAQAKSWVHRLAFPIVIATVLFVVVDIEYPRHGLIRVDAIDQLMVDLRNSMG
jgi:hypothetical protein